MGLCTHVKCALFDRGIISGVYPVGLYTSHSQRPSGGHKDVSIVLQKDPD
jgi:hypothetical protein